jgi:transcription factor-like protein
LVDGVETDVDHRFLHHYVSEFSRVLTLVNDASNPFHNIILPMATQHRGLMHSLMCLSGSHLSARHPDQGIKERHLYHFHRAVTCLVKELNTANTALYNPDAILASAMALCLHSICEGETNGEYRPHLDAARKVLVTHRIRDEKFRQFIIEFFQYHDVSNSITSLDRRPRHLNLQDFLPHPPPESGTLLGIFDGLFANACKITKLRDRVRKRYGDGFKPAIEMQSLNEAVTIDLALRTWKSCYLQDSPNWIAAELHRLSTWLYLWRTVYPSQPNAKISGVVNDGLAYLGMLPREAGANSVVLMPLFLLGCSAFELGQREQVKKGFVALQAYSNLRNIKPALTVVEKVWDLMDNNPEESWDWENIMKDMKMDFLIT